MSFTQDFALKQNLTVRERQILNANPDVAEGWVVAASYARMVSNAYGYTTGDLQKSSGLGKTDALRHCLWSALLTYQVGERFAKQLTDAHEAPGAIGDPNTRLDREMDFHNNAVGRRFGAVHSQSGMVAKAMTAFFLYGISKTALDSGQLKVIDRREKVWKLVPSNSPFVI